MQFIKKQRLLITETETFVKSILGDDSSGHDWWHIHRVRKLAIQIGKAEGADLFLVELAALLHDIDDWKLTDPQATENRVRSWLEKCGVEHSVSDRVCRIIEGVSFKGAGVDTSTADQECRVLQDADRLDAIGAIGIARTFAYGGSRGRGIYDPAIPPVNHADFENYKKSNGPTINHFYEKLVLLKDLMQTNTGKIIAKQRHEYMLGFLDQFFREWNSDL